MKISEKIKSEQIKALVEGMRSQLALPSDQAIADFFGVNRSTVQRWKKATTKVRDTDLLVCKLGCAQEVFEQMMRKEIDIHYFIQQHAPLWQSHLNDYEEIGRLVNEILPRTDIVNVLKVLQAVTEIVTNRLLRQIDE